MAQLPYMSASRAYARKDLVRQFQELHVGHVLQDTNDLAAIAKLVVVPDIHHCVIAVGDGRFSIDDARMTVPDEIRRDHFGRVDEIDLLLVSGVDGQRLWRHRVRSIPCSVPHCDHDGRLCGSCR